MQALDLLRALPQSGGLASYLSAQRALLARVGAGAGSLRASGAESTTRLTGWLQRQTTGAG